MINLERKKIFSLVMTLLIAIEIFYFSSLSFGPSAKGVISFSSIYHFVVFFLFSFFLFMTIKGSKKIKIKHLLIVLFTSLIYAVLDEFHQSFVLYRDASVRDILTDSAGIFFSLIIYLYINKKQNKKESV